jgi:hypothetical protein
MAIVTVQSFAVSTSATFTGSPVTRATQRNPLSIEAAVTAMEFASIDAVECIAGCVSAPVGRWRRTEDVAPKRLRPTVTTAKLNNLRNQIVRNRTERPQAARHQSVALLTGSRRF